mgnify:CR=1 FL=1
MDYKIRDIELASFYLAWQHTAFYKPRDSAASFRIGRNRETITRSDDPPPRLAGSHCVAQCIYPGSRFCV